MGETTTRTKVITVTLNPSLDRTLVTHFLALGYHNQTTETTRLDPAGRGIGVSRALHALGAPTHAIVLIGEDATGRAYQALLAEEQFPMTVLRRAGQTSSRTIIKDTGHAHETEIWETSTDVTESDLQAVADALTELISEGDTVVFAGSLPRGVPDDTYVWLTDAAQEAGARVALNAGGGQALRASLRAQPELVYLTQIEAEGLFNIPVRAEEDIVYCARKLREEGAGAVLIAKMQSNTAVFDAEQDGWTVSWPEGVGTHSGQNAAMIAGFLAGQLRSEDVDQALALGAAATAYTLTQVGHEFGSLKDVRDQVEQVDVIPLDDAQDADQPDDR
ncbi:MAG: PfkB family carbohydrate kinase [Chloroflexota bacterium]